ncbi:MAG: D-alanine--D-alanine ligase [Myxococcota bacterium]
MSEQLRVGVLMGGMSTERSVSFNSGKAVAAALRRRGHDVVEIDVGPDLPAKLIAEKIDVAWIALHGAFGEDGTVQGVLELMRIPYTGSPVRASAVAMDKILTKRVLRDHDVLLPQDRVWRKGEALPEDIALPVVVKTPSGGSTIGVFICETPAELEKAAADCLQWSDTVLIEQKIIGEEITAAVLDGVALPIVSIRPKSGFFDFEAKYQKGQTEYLVPSPLPAGVTTWAQRQAKTAYDALGLAGVARADFIVDDQGRPWFLEINTIPGMTATSLSPMAAQAKGISFDGLVDHLLGQARLWLEVAGS